eukprot:Trichotokara_eunicae@DN6891_c0_g1_i1.p1
MGGEKLNVNYFKEFEIYQDVGSSRFPLNPIVRIRHKLTSKQKVIQFCRVVEIGCDGLWCIKKDTVRLLTCVEYITENDIKELFNMTTSNNEILDQTFSKLLGKKKKKKKKKKKYSA